MAETYRIYGAEASPYSVKVRGYFRYKGIPHEWIPRTVDRMEEFQRYAKLPLIPCVVAPDETAMQDSTPIIEKMEARFPNPSIVPDDPAAAFLSALIEEYAEPDYVCFPHHQPPTQSVFHPSTPLLRLYLSQCLKSLRQA